MGLRGLSGSFFGAPAQCVYVCVLFLRGGDVPLAKYRSRVKLFIPYSAFRLYPVKYIISPRVKI